MPMGKQSFPVVDEERLGIIGPTRDARILMVVFTIRNGKIRPISARPANRKERKNHEQYLHQILERI